MRMRPSEDSVSGRAPLLWSCAAYPVELYAGWMFAACLPLGPVVMSNVTR
jgi:hypothetical protein